MDAPDPTPFLTWDNAATPAAAILALSLLLGALSLPILLFQLNAIRAHLRASRIHIRESRDWLRRNAAEQRTADYRSLLHRPELLTRHLDYIERQSAVTLENIRQAKAEEPEVIDALHSLLDYYDSTARAIDSGVLSERVIRAAQHERMLRAARLFRPYIDHYRLQALPEAWTALDRLLIKWSETPARPASPPAAAPPAKRAA